MEQDCERLVEDGTLKVIEARPYFLYTVFSSRSCGHLLDVFLFAPPEEAIDNYVSFTVP